MCECTLVNKHMCQCISSHDESDRERERENERHFLKKLAHGIMEAGKSKVYRMGWQSRDPGKSQCYSLSLKVICCRIPSYFGGGQSFVLFRPSADWRRPTHIERNLFYSKSTDSNVHLIQKHPHRNI